LLQAVTGIRSMPRNYESLIGIADVHAGRGVYDMFACLSIAKRVYAGRGIDEASVSDDEAVVRYYVYDMPSFGFNHNVPR